MVSRDNSDRRHRLGRIGLAVAATLFVGILFFRGSPDARQDAIPAGPWTAQQRGAWYFRSAGFGGLAVDPLETHAIPWKLVAAALILEARRTDDTLPIKPSSLRPILSRFGFLFPDQVGNWPADLQQPSPTPLPLGMTHGSLSPVRGLRVDIANLGCAACHAGTTYAADGRANPRQAWLGMPNSSLDLEGYTTAVFRALRAQVGPDDRLLAATFALFPEMSARERFALRWLVLPRVRKRIGELSGATGPLPFPNGIPGSTNGVAALKAALGTPLMDGGAGELGFVSIPDLGDRDWRRSLLVDGAYAIPGSDPDRPTLASDRSAKHRESLAAITTFFTVPSMGVHPNKSAGSLGEARATIAFLAAYRPQPFPGKKNLTLADAGAAVYARECAACHGRYNRAERPEMVEYPNWIGDVGTDPLRAQAMDGPLVAAVARSPYRDRIAVRHGRRYAAPPLSGVWASAPYLHNGSVPTIAALLDPSARPKRFMVGGHALDLAALGIRLDRAGRYPAGLQPWSRPAWTDTTKAGLGNGGHEFGANLPAEEKRSLIEFLKLL